MRIKKFISPHIFLGYDFWLVMHFSKNASKNFGFFRNKQLNLCYWNTHGKNSKISPGISET